MSSLKRILSLVVVFAMLLSVSVFADGPETPDEGEPAAVETASETAETVDLPAADAAIETAAAAVETANEVLGTLEAIAPETTEETDTSGEAIEAAAEAGDLDALAAIVEAAAESAKADAETAKAAAETTQTAADALQEQVETGTFEYISDETEFDAVDEESGETYTTTGQALIESAKEVAAAANEAAENAEVASENAANAADAAQYALENADEPATEEEQQIVETAKEAAAEAAEKSEAAKEAAKEVEAVIVTATATAEEAAEIVAKAADAAKDAADAANKAAEAAQDAANTIAIIRNVDETHTEDEVDAAKAVVVEKVERAVELAKVADEKAEIAKEAAARAKDVTLSGEEKAQAIAEAAKAAKEATKAANEAADAANEAAEAAYSLAEQKGWPFYGKVVTAKGVIVTARAQAGVFPKGTELTAEDVEAEQVEEQMDVAARDVVTAVDINFWLGEAKIQPDTSKGLVDVTIEDPNAEAVPTAVKTVKDGVTETLAVEVEDGVVAFEAEHFTTYATVQASDGVAKVLMSKVTASNLSNDTGNDGTYYYFASLADAVGAADSGATVTLIKNADGAGIFLAEADCKTVTIDLGGFTFTCSGPAVGSAGTQSQAFHLEKGNTVTLQNGTISSTIGSGVKMLVQNYCNLTLSNVTLDGQNIGSGQYTLSNNCGVVAINAGTVIDAPSDGFVFDACVTNYYPAGTQITVNGGTFNGKVEYGIWGSIPANNEVSLTINGGVFNGTFAISEDLAAGAAEHISITGGTFKVKTANDLRKVLDYTKADATGVTIELLNDITINEYIEVIKSITINGGDHKITAQSNASRMLRIGSSNVTVNLNHIKFDGNSVAERAVQVDSDKSNVTLNIDSCDMWNISYYTVNVCSGVTGLDLNIKKSYIAGWGAINLWGNTYSVSISDTELVGTNPFSSGSNAFGVVVLEGDTTGQTDLHVENCNVELDNCIITAIENGTMWQWAILFNNPSAHNTVTLKGDGTRVTYPGRYYYTDNTYTAIADMLCRNENETNNLIIEGGTYSKYNSEGDKLSDYVASGYKEVANSDDTWTVYPIVAHAAVTETCTAAGNSAYWSVNNTKYYSNAACENEIEADSWVIPALGHSWGAWTVVTPATYTSTGLEQRVCANDASHVETRVLPMLEYTYDDSSDDTTTAATTQEPQQTTTIEEEATPLAALPESLSEVLVAVTNEAGETVEVAVSELPNVYADVEDDSWSRDAIAYANALGLMNGVGADENGEASFNPQGTTTSEMLTTVLYRATSGETTSGENWAEDAIAWAADANLTEGLGLVEGEAVTREQMVTMMYRVAEARGFDVAATTDLTGYTDADKMSEFARAAMEWAVSVGLINGTDVDKLSPDAEVTREQIATILMRFNEMTKDVI